MNTYTWKHRTGFARFVAAAFLSISSNVYAQQVGRAPVDVQILTTPTALFALGRTQIVYELHLTNFGSGTLGLRQIDALDSTNAVLGSWKELALAQRVIAVGAQAVSQNSPSDRLELKPGARSVAYMWIALAQGMKKPVTIHHRLIFQSSTKSDTVFTKSTSLDQGSLVSLIPPVADGPWVALRGPANSSGHRLSFVAVNGEAAIPQRYAVDWAKLGTDGKLFHGDSTINANWYGYGTPVKSVASGTVVWARADVLEHSALTLVAPDVVEAADALGNAIIVDIGSGRFATYAHLKPGSLLVKLGDRVSAGQTIAALGNSGNSLAPHLHFHISSSPKPLGGEGLPYVLPAFELMGRVNSAASLLSGMAWTLNPAQPARRVEGETPLENMVVRFNP
ncbi:MAG: M23 family metallopeptidase [Gemmatimonadaceae bacterium]